MERKLRWFVLEDDTQKPFSIGVADKLKGTIIIILIIVSIAVLFANLYNKAYSIEDNLKHVIWAIFLAGTHVSYLYIVLNILILGNPIEKLYWQRLTFPIILLFAYIFYALEIWASLSLNIPFSHYEQIFKLISLFLFLLLYILWLLRDYFEYKKDKKTINLIWIAGELLSIVSLFIGICVVIKDEEYSWIASQNSPVIICLLIYIFFRYLYEHIQEQERYTDIYTHYLSYNKIRNDISIDLKLNNNSKELTILDFGCGDGSRLLENLSWIINISFPSIKVVGFDKRRTFESKYEKIKDKIKTYIFVSDIEELKPEEFDIVIISHVLYEQPVVNMLFSFLKKCKKDTIIFFRGASPNSFFVSMSFAGANTFSIFSRKKNRSHLWYSIWLEEIKSGVPLERFNKNIESYKPDYVIEQDYDISKKEAIESAGFLLRKLYNGTFANRADEYFNNLHKYSNYKTIPNDDLIYLYIKQ